MCKTAIITGFLGQKFDEKLTSKLENLVKKAIEEYDVTDFYFCNMAEEDFDDDTMNELQKDYKLAHEFIAQEIRKYKKENNNVEINTILVVGKSEDENYNAELYNDIIQSFPINFSELENSNSFDAYALRDRFLSKHIDLIFWYSNKILIFKSPLVNDAMIYGKEIIYR